MEVNEEAADEKPIKAFMFSVENGRDYRLMYPLQLEPTGRIQYFDERPPFDPTRYMYNPIFWMIGISLLMN